MSREFKEILQEAIEILDKNGIEMLCRLRNISFIMDDILFKSAEITLARKKEEPKPERTYHIGQRFMLGDREQILAICENKEPDHGDPAYIALIDINPKGSKCGKYHSPSIKVNDFDRITEQEFKEICGGSTDEFTLINDTESHKEPEQTYHVGQTFKSELNDEIFMLSCHFGHQVKNDTDFPLIRKDVSLIVISGINKGNCHHGYLGSLIKYPVSVHVNDINKITQDEFEQICGYPEEKFTLIEDADGN